MRATLLDVHPAPELQLPGWVPPANTLEAMPAGRWWDAIVVPQLAALDALEILDHVTGRSPGPVVWDMGAREPKLYFLVWPGAAERWDVPETTALAKGSFVVLPGPTTIAPPGVYWLVPPDPDDPDGLVDAAALRRALLMASGRAT